MNKKYRFDPSKFSVMRRNIILLYGLTVVVLMGIVFAMTYKSPSTFSMILLGIVVLIVFGYTALRSIKQRKELWEEYALSLDETGLTQHQPKYPDLHIARESIYGIDDKKKDLLILGKNGGSIFAIPKELTDADFAEIKGVLTSWCETRADDPEEEEDLDEIEALPLDSDEPGEEN